jgi:hypothetical protein
MNSQQQLGGMVPGPLGGGMPQSKEQAEAQMKKQQYVCCQCDLEAVDMCREYTTSVVNTGDTLFTTTCQLQGS